MTRGRRGAWGVLVATAAAWGQTASAPTDLTGPLGAEAAAANALRAAAGAAEVLQTDHFVIAYTAPATSARELAARLESVYAAHVALVRQFKLPARRPTRKLPVVLLSSHAAFVEHLRREGVEAGELLGCYLPAAGRCVYFDLDTYPPLAALRAEADASGQEALRRRFERRCAALALSVVQHEAAHQMQAGLGLVPPGPAAPVWLREGLAMRFEVPLAADGRPLSARNAYRLYEFQRLLRDRGAPRALPEFVLDDAAWRGGPDYSLAWALVEYLQEAHPREFATLLRRMMDAGLPTAPDQRRALLDELFGPIDAAWMQRFHSHVMAWPFDGNFGEDG